MNKFIVVVIDATNTEIGLRTLRVDANDMLKAIDYTRKAGYEIVCQYPWESAIRQVQERHADHPDLTVHEELQAKWASACKAVANAGPVAEIQ